MPLFSFRAPEQSGASVTCQLADHKEARGELTKVCADLIGQICRNLTENSEWSMELLDEFKKPVFRIRLVAETLE